MKNLMTICLVVLAPAFCSNVQSATRNVPGDYGTIQAAIDAAFYGDTVEVAAGTYNECIELKNGVAVIGAGSSSTTIDGDDANSVVKAIGCDANTVLEGFTITDGNAATGGGMYNEDSNTTITDCNFSGNSTSGGSDNKGGGMYNYYSSPTVTDCEFSGNLAFSDESRVTGGGGMYNENGNPTVTNCIFSNNTVSRVGSYTYGGGMLNNNSSPTVTDCEFSGNEASYGGGMFNDYSSSPTVTNCIFSGNRSTGMENWLSSPTVTDCEFTGNSHGMYNGSSSDATVTNCTFTGNKARGMFNSSSDATVTNCTFTGNKNIGMWNWTSNTTVTGCTFTGNSANQGGGMYNYSSSPTVTNCTFTGNRADYRGGGMYNWGMYGATCNPTITNCIMWGNTAEEGDEIYNTPSSKPTISFSDIAGCGGEWIGWDVWGVDDGGNMDTGPLFVDPGWWDTNGTPEDPADDIWVNGDYHLSPGSPCIDAGDNDAVADVDFDLDGNPRIANGVVDMGAYEYCDYEPEIEVSPLAWDLGDVELEESNSVIVTIFNTGNGDLIVDGLVFATGSDPEIAIPSPPTLPLVIAPEDSVDIEVVFTPLAEQCYSADLEIESNDPDEPLITVELDGCGVPVETPPSEQIEAIIAFIEGGDVAGTGVQPDKKIEVLVNMVGSVSDLIIAEDLEKACQQLSIILRKCDGDDTPPDFVKDAVGGATAILAGMIEELMEDLGC